MRYAWLFYEEYFGRGRLKRAALAPILSALRRWDLRSSRRVDRFVAISECVRERIRHFYGRDADVVYPPVDTERLTPSRQPPGEYDLIVSGLSPLKRVDLAVTVYNQTGRKLKIVGVGTQMDSLRRLAGDNIEFLGWVSDEDVLGLYRGCRLLVFPGVDDFGLAPVEAQACGRPVVAYAEGGALETVEDGVTGVFFRERTPESLNSAIERCESLYWDSDAIRSRAERYGIERFRAELMSSIERCLVV
jgi:glycosyltransferase involved in cell wall biosynthesis